MINNPTLDNDIKKGNEILELKHLTGIIKAKTSSGNWVVGMVTLIVLTGLVTMGILRELWDRQLQQQTCQGVLISGLDEKKLEFLKQNCVAK